MDKKKAARKKPKKKVTPKAAPVPPPSQVPDMSTESMLWRGWAFDDDDGPPRD